MSAHDPFDGNYDDAPAQAEQAAEQADAPAPAVEVHVYTRSQLEQMRKAQLQAVARERELSPAGDRDDLIERIEAAQGASA